MTPGFGYFFHLLSRPVHFSCKLVLVPHCKETISKRIFKKNTFKKRLEGERRPHP